MISDGMDEIRRSGESKNAPEHWIEGEQLQRLDHVRALSDAMHRVSQVDDSIDDCGARWTACLDSICKRIRTLPCAKLWAVESSSVDENSYLYDAKSSPTSTISSQSGARAIPRASRDLANLQVQSISTLDISEEVVTTPSSSAAACARVNNNEGVCESSALSGIHSSEDRVDLEIDDGGLRLGLHRVLVRVGARVPWGRRHRARFAKVSNY